MCVVGRSDFEFGSQIHACFVKCGGGATKNALRAFDRMPECGVMAGKCSMVPTVNNRLDAFLLGVVEAIQFSLEIGLSDLVLECDNAEFFRALQKEGVSLAPSGLLISDVKNLIARCHSVEFSLVAKGGNNLAQAITSYAINVTDSIVWIKELPISFSAILAADLILQC